MTTKLEGGTIIQTTESTSKTSTSLPTSGQYFIDQATGQYYYQDGDIMTVVQTGDAEQEGTSQESNNQVVLNTGGDQYQTVTIVPSDGGNASGSAGEVSYVLIVQPDEKKKGGSGQGDEGGMAIYDFDGEDNEDLDDDLDIDDKSKPLKGTRKSQVVSQAHMCNYCNYTTPKRYLLARHLKSHSEERPHKCSVCERGFKTLASLQNHVNTHTGTKPHRCKFCDSSFTTSGELVRHVRYRHTHEKPHKCPDCDYSSVELSKLKRHMRCHTGERPFQCPHCTYASPDTFKLKRHMRIHTGEKPYECDICHARFTQSNSLKAHRMIHTGDKPVFQCDLCPTTCGRKTDLRLHVRKLHTSEKPMHCKMCGKSFPDRYTLKVHKKTHEGEKCFKCDLCPYSSISQRHLEAHMLIHTDQKPFKCEHCEQSFRQRQLLKRHQNLYHTPNYVPPTPKEKTHECPECGRSFRHKGNLIRHMALHDPDSTAAEKAAALRIGRQKKIQVIDGQQVEVLAEGGAEDEDFDEDGNLIDDSEASPSTSSSTSKTSKHGKAVKGKDGQKFVVLEVIEMGEKSAEIKKETAGSSAAEPRKRKTKTSKGTRSEVESNLSKGVEDCFGFDDDEEN